MNSKKLATVTGAGLVAALGGLATTVPVHAQIKVPLNAGTNVTNDQEEHLARVSQARQDVSEANQRVTSASNNLASVQQAVGSTAVYDQSAVQSAQSAVNVASDAVQSATETVNSASALAGNTSSERLASASQALTAQSMGVSQDQQALESANAVADSASLVATSTATALTSAQQIYDQKSAALSTATANFSTAQNVLNNGSALADSASTKLAEASAAFNSASLEYSTAQSTVDSLSAVWTIASQNAATAQSMVNSASVDASTANATFASQNSAYQSLSTVATDAASSYVTAQQTTSTAQSEYDLASTALATGTTVDDILGNNTIHLSDQYIAALENLINYEREHPDDDTSDTFNGLKNAIQAVVPGLGTDGRVAGFTYTDIPADETEPVTDLANLTDAQMIELSQFAASLINQMRAQLEEAPLEVTPKSIAFAKDIVTNGYDNANWQVFATISNQKSRGHNSDYLDQAMRAQHAYGVKENVGMGIEGYSSANNYALSQVLPSATMNDLKRAIYYDLTLMMFGDGRSNWSHATQFMVPDSGTTDTLGVDFDKYGFTHYDVAGANATNGFGDDAYVLVGDGSAERAQAAYDQASTALANAQTAEQAASTAASIANDHLAQASNDFTTASMNAATAQNTANSVTASETPIIDAAQQTFAGLSIAQSTAAAQSQALAVAQNDQTTASNNYTAATDRTVAQSNYDQASTALTSATDEANRASDGLTTATSTNASALTAFTSVATTASEAESTYNRDNNVWQSNSVEYMNLQSAGTILTSAQNVLSEKQSVLAVAQSELASVTAEYASTSVADSTAQSLLNQASEALDSAIQDRDQKQQTLDELLAATHSQAEDFGTEIALQPITIYVGEDVGDPVIINPATIEVHPLADSLAQSFRVVLPPLSGEATLAAIPAGTVAKWLSPTQLAADAQTPGDYHEDVELTFPDGSTYNTKAELHVLAAASHHDGQSQSTGQGGNINSGQNNTASHQQAPYRIVDGQIVDANGNVVKNMFIRGNQIVDGQGRVMAVQVNDQTGEVFPISNPGKQGSQGQGARRLPQTGDDETNEFAVLGLATVSFMEMLDLAKKRQFN